MNNEEIEILEQKKKGSKRPYVTAIALALLLVVTITATSYAYFVANVTNDGSVTNTVVTTGSLSLEFTDGPEVGLENAIPGSYVVKTFKVENTGGGDTTYDVYMSDLINDFADKTDLVYTLTSPDGGVNISTQTQVPSTSSKIVDSKLIRVGETHNYTLRIDFLETNDNQDNNKNKSFSTVIRVNEVHDAVPPTAVETITTLAPTEPSIVDDGTTDNNLRYIGANPNNYVQFNNELWRIIGAMNNIETESGNTESLLKIRRVDSLGNYSWDSSANNINDGDGINEWSQADLMKELNNDYLGNVTVGTDGNWYSQRNNTKETSMPSTTISSAAQSMIQSVKWKLGSMSNNNGIYDSSWPNLTVSTSYIREKSNYTGKVCSSGDYCNDTETRTTAWTGKVALFYPSDYLFATGGGSTTNRTACLELALYTDWSNSSYADCKDNDWLTPTNRYDWSLSPSAIYSNARSVFRVGASDSITSDIAGYPYGVRPVVFLKSNVKITGGTGTSTDPYTLSL